MSPELNEVLGDNALYSGRLSLTHDTRDSPFAATEGHLLELSFEQVFGTYSYPRGNVDYRRYFLLNERPDGSGRHTLGASLQVGISGSDTPLYENFFAGGYSTLRGFRFRSANPKSGDVYVGGEFSFLGSLEYMFPITADDMMKGVVFCDYGTIEEKVQIRKGRLPRRLGCRPAHLDPRHGPRADRLGLCRTGRPRRYRPHSELQLLRRLRPLGQLAGSDGGYLAHAPRIPRHRQPLRLRFERLPELEDLFGIKHLVVVSKQPLQRRLVNLHLRAADTDRAVAQHTALVLRRVRHANPFDAGRRNGVQVDGHAQGGTGIPCASAAARARRPRPPR